MITAMQARTIGYTHENYIIVCLKCAEKTYGLSAHFDDYGRYQRQEFWPQRVSYYRWSEEHTCTECGGRCSESDDCLCKDGCEHRPVCDSCGVALE